MQVKEKMSILYYSTVYIKDFHLTAKTTSYISFTNSQNIKVGTLMTLILNSQFNLMTALHIGITKLLFIFWVKLVTLYNKYSLLCMELSNNFYSIQFNKDKKEII